MFVIKLQQIAVGLPVTTAQREGISCVQLLLPGNIPLVLENLLTESHWFRVVGLRVEQKGRRVSKTSENCFKSINVWPIFSCKKLPSARHS